MTPRRDEHIELSASKGALTWVRWLIGTLIAAGILGSGGVAANNLDTRVESLEEIVNDNTLEISGQKIRLSEYDAKFVEMRSDIKVTQADVKQILIILQKR